MDLNKFFHRYIDGFYTSKEISQLKNELSRPDAANQFYAVSDEVWKASSANATSSAEEYHNYREEAKSLLTRIQDNNYKKKHKNIWTMPYYKVGMVAVAFLMTIVGALLMNLYTSEHILDVQYVTSSTGIGESKEIILPDGTSIKLNSCSQIKYPQEFGSAFREIELTGEAFLNVSHIEEQPFIVHTEHIKIQVLGTCFNVKTYAHDKNSTVFVKSGLVKVSIPDADVYLHQQEGISLDTRSGNFSKYMSSTDVSAWRSGMLQFENTPLKDVINALERHYGCSISYDEKLVNQFTITGEHENSNLESVLKSIAYITKLKYKIKENNVVEIYQ